MPGIEINRAAPEDAEEIFALVNSCRGYLREWLPWVDTTTVLNDTLLFIIEFMNKNVFNGREVNTIRYDGKIAGMIDLQNGDSFNRKAEIGYWLGEQYQGKGIMTLSCRLIINRAFYEYGINRLTIKVAIDNIKSRKIPERLGFKEEGIERSGELLNGKYIDLMVYSLLQKEWLNMENVKLVPAKA